MQQQHATPASPHPALHFSPAVASARAAGRPIVALESTIVAHGMPWPQNLHMAREVEAVVCAHGAEPATVAVVDGHIRIGLDDETLQRLARCGNAAAKVSQIGRAHV